MNRRKSTPFILGAVGVGAWLAVRALRQYHYNLSGKTVLITGGSRGLGLVLARQIAEQGAKVAICARDQGELDRAYQDLAQRGGRVLAVPCDVTDPDQVGEMVRVVGRRLGPIDVLINNAGVITV